MPASAKETSIDRLAFAERIYRRAYELCAQRSYQSGSDLNDRLQTEEEILWAERDIRVDAYEESFPASDPPAC